MKGLTFAVLLAFASLGGGSLVRIPADQVRFAYTGFDSSVRLEAFKLVYGFKQCHLLCRVNNFNQYVAPERQIRTIRIDAGSADAVNVREPTVLHVGINWFRLEAEPATRFSALFIAHEMGHLLLDSLTPDRQEEFSRIFGLVEAARFAEHRVFPGYPMPLGHPDSPEELFASAFAVWYAAGIGRLEERGSQVADFFRRHIEPLGISDSGMCQMWKPAKF